MLDVSDYDVLVFEAVVHFLADVAAVLGKLGSGAILEILDPIVLPLYLCGYAVVQLLLPGQPFLLFNGESLLDLGTLLVKGLDDLALLLDTGIPLSVYAGFDGPEVGADGGQLRFERVDAVFALLPDHALQGGHPVMPADPLRLHVVRLLLHASVQLICEICQHLQIGVLELFELIIDLLALVDGVLLVVLDLLVDVLELQLEPPLRVVPEPHHLLEVPVHLAHLLPETPQLQVVLNRLLVHFFISYYYF